MAIQYYKLLWVILYRLPEKERKETAKEAVKRGTEEKEGQESEGTEVVKLFILLPLPATRIA